jgi:hypothetical protein
LRSDLLPSVKAEPRPLTKSTARRTKHIWHTGLAF